MHAVCESGRGRSRMRSHGIRMHACGATTSGRACDAPTWTRGPSATAVPTACTAAGITYRQLDYWARTGLVVPSVRDASGSGTQRLYSFRDIVVLKVVKRLLDAGVSLQNIRKAIETLRQRGVDDLATMTLISDGTTVYECRSAEEVVDLLQGGQGVFGIAIGGAFKEIQGSLADLPAEPATAAEDADGRARPRTSTERRRAGRPPGPPPRRLTRRRPSAPARTPPAHPQQDDHQTPVDHPRSTGVSAAPTEAASPRGTKGGVASLRTYGGPARIGRMAAQRVLVALFDGVQSLDVTGPVEVFAGAEQARPGSYTIRTGSIGGRPVRTSSGLRLHPDDDLTPADAQRPADLLLIPGGDGTRASDPRLVDWLRGRRSAGAPRVTSVCTGADVLAVAGLLDGRRATIHWAWCDEFLAPYPYVTVDAEPIFVRDGKVWTSAGVTAGMDLALALVDEDLGRTSCR